MVRVRVWLSIRGVDKGGYGHFRDGSCTGQASLLQLTPAPCVIDGQLGRERGGAIALPVGPTAQAAWSGEPEKAAEGRTAREAERATRKALLCREEKITESLEGGSHCRLGCM